MYSIQMIRKVDDLNVIQVVAHTKAEAMEICNFCVRFDIDFSCMNYEGLTESLEK